METRKTMGERMAERLKGREDAYARLELSTSRFDDHFSRFARTRRVSRLGALLYPDGVMPMASPSASPGGGDATWLSAEPYWERMTRLGNARLRREQRLSGLNSHSQRRMNLSAARRLPDVRPRSVPFWGLTGLVPNQFEVLAPLASVSEQPLAAHTPEAFGGQGGPWRGASRSDSPWSSHAYSPAKVAQSRSQSSVKKRPLERIQERAPAPETAVKGLKRLIEVQRSSSRLAAKKPTDIQMAAFGQQQATASTADGGPTRKVRRSMKGRSNPTRAVVYDYERALPDDFLPPSRHAQGRMASPLTSRTRGLRLAMSRSPLMKALTPVLPTGGHGHSGLEASPISVPPRVTTGVGRTTTRRTAHRGELPTRALLSASPVRRPAIVAPSAVTLAGPDQGSSGPISPVRRSAIVAPSAVTLAGPDQGSSGPVSSVRRSAIVAPSAVTLAAPGPVSPRPSPARADRYLAPMVRALARSVVTPEPLVVRPLGQRGPVPGRSKVSGGFEPTALTRRQAVRSSANGNAIERMAVLSPMSSADLGLPYSETQSSKPVSRAARSHRLALGDGGVFVPESTILARAQAALDLRSPTGSSTPKEGPQVAPPDEARPLAAAATRLDAKSGHLAKTPARRLRAKAYPVEAEVLQPLPLMPSGQGTENAQSQHAATRAERIPTVARSTTRVVQGFAKTAQRKVASRSPERHGTHEDPQPRRRLSPKLFRNPLSHIRVVSPTRGAQATMAGSGSESVVLQPEAGSTQSLAEGSTLRQAQEAAQERVVRAWKRVGRPLDWTEARVEVIQVPMMVKTAESAGHLPRTQRMHDGSYVPVRTGGTRQNSALGVAPVILARPEAQGTVYAEGTSDADPRRTPSAQFSPPSEQGGPVSVRGAVSPRGQVGAWRSGFDATMAGVGQGTVHTDMPIWAQRSAGGLRNVGNGDLLTQLASASAPEDVVSVLMSGSDTVRRGTSGLSQPVIQVIQQIRTEAARADQAAAQEQQTQQARTSWPNQTPPARSRRSEGVRSTTRVARGMTGLKPGGSSAGASSQAMNKVTKLAKRLQDLIALADGQNRSGARQQVRMAEDSGAARAEGHSAQGPSAQGRDSTADIGSLAREVTEQVTRELEMRRERRQEDPDGRSIWW